MEENKKSDKKKRHRKKYAERYRVKRLMKRYGITQEQHEELYKFQKSCCLICGRHESANVLGLQVDHCHSTNKVRGLLCPSCNQGLGLFQDNPTLLEAAASYIREHGSKIEHIVGEKHEQKED